MRACEALSHGGPKGAAFRPVPFQHASSDSLVPLLPTNHGRVTVTGSPPVLGTTGFHENTWPS